ncbi:Asp-tRNA(Asn)/Glu-tRNA(Gln) amidotransferase GatCAB subunit C [Candidatus Cerribacteria bacterium 'Amazon FNV 2010 28 9']|uniref:Aspartyl/glutamyl-tRNA(Asn/Gln) amidotransferase subunit C n=1 Tax=Candidatus Cerribacteria bacterium 'Amazon FNV 2010 28 9' TaxID=2081795 RepID=A0A317JP19_9BACT|nr:MAG: Asp-tRNA(Asn)/Glu-tRNA(Gln) amidotransferase GatCAB subunit C [Candidatus Cerribacteria bacterium 'Amazon FNV 2010 28 9']
MQTVTADITAHIAHLANLPLTPDQIEKYAPQLNSVLEYTQQASMLSTDGVAETSQVTGLENILREDVVERSRMFTQEEALSNAHRTHNGYFVVPALLQE